MLSCLGSDIHFPGTLCRNKLTRSKRWCSHHIVQAQRQVSKYHQLHNQLDQKLTELWINKPFTQFREVVAKKANRKKFWEAIATLSQHQKSAIIRLTLYMLQRVKQTRIKHQQTCWVVNSCPRHLEYIQKLAHFQHQLRLFSIHFVPTLLFTPSQNSDNEIPMLVKPSIEPSREEPPLDPSQEETEFSEGVSKKPSERIEEPPLDPSREETEFSEPSKEKERKFKKPKKSKIQKQLEGITLQDESWKEWCKMQRIELNSIPFWIVLLEKSWTIQNIWDFPTISEALNEIQSRMVKTKLYVPLAVLQMHYSKTIEFPNQSLKYLHSGECGQLSFLRYSVFPFFSVGEGGQLTIIDSYRSNKFFIPLRLTASTAEWIYFEFHPKMESKTTTRVDYQTGTWSFPPVLTLAIQVLHSYFIAKIYSFSKPSDFYHFIRFFSSFFANQAIHLLNSAGQFALSPNPKLARFFYPCLRIMTSHSLNQLLSLQSKSKSNFIVDDHDFHLISNVILSLLYHVVPETPKNFPLSCGVFQSFIVCVILEKIFACFTHMYQKPEKFKQNFPILSLLQHLPPNSQQGTFDFCPKQIKQKKISRDFSFFISKQTVTSSTETLRRLEQTIKS